MKIELKAQGRVAGDEMMVAIRKSFSVRDWTRISVNVAGEGFLLGEIGAPRRMMRMLIQLKDGGKVSLDIPEDIKFDVETTRERPEATFRIPFMLQ